MRFIGGPDAMTNDDEDDHYRLSDEDNASPGSRSSISFLAM
jgi:hypothetical protein